MKKRLESIEALRALACIAIFLFHSGIRVSGSGASCLFIMLSGFTLSYSELRRDSFTKPQLIGSLRSAVKRVWKLYPLYIICMLPVVALELWEMSHAFTAAGLRAFAGKLLANIFLVQSWVPDSEVAVAFNGVAWFLSTILFLYFCFPFIFSVMRRLQSTAAAITAIILLAAAQILIGFAAPSLESMLQAAGLIAQGSKFIYWFSYIFPLFRVFDFSIGCILAWIYLKAKPGKAACTVLELGTLILLVITHIVYIRTESLPSWEAFKYTQIYVPFSALAIFSFASAQGPCVKLLTNRVTLFIAGISSDFFLLHQNIIRFSIMFLTMAAIPFAAIKLIVPPLCFVLSVAACLIWAWLQKKLRTGLSRN